MTTENEKLQGILTILDGWYEQSGALGREFRAALARTGVPEVIAAEWFDNHAQAYFIMRRGHDDGFKQVIEYAPFMTEVSEDLFSVRAHEGTHALQAFRAACIHAHPGGSNNNKIYLRPRDKVWVWELLEKDAYAKACLLGTQFYVHSTGKAANSDLQPGSVALQRKTVEIVKKLLDEIMVPATEYEPALSGKEYYNRAALGEYEDYAAAMAEIRKKTGAASALQMMKKHKFPIPVYVRLEPQDIADIGASFGPNLFNEDICGPDFTKLSLSPHMEAAVKSMNERLEIEDEESLPTFGEVLAQNGLDRVEFLALSRQ